MVDAIDDLKAQARVLHRLVRSSDVTALERLRTLDGWSEWSDGALKDRVRRKHCLLLVAQEFGFKNWVHAVTVLSSASSGDFGTLLYPIGANAYWNVWSAHYEEALRIREEHGGFLLAYRQQYLIVDEFFIGTLGLDPKDPDWNAIGRDWVCPRLPEARQRLYAKLIEQRRRHRSRIEPWMKRHAGREGRPTKE